MIPNFKAHPWHGITAGQDAPNVVNAVSYTHLDVYKRQALINSPKIIFADEPTGNLDSKNADDLHQLFFDLRDKYNQTFVIVTHNTHLADTTDRKLVMKDGQIIN